MSSMKRKSITTSSATPAMSDKNKKQRLNIGQSPRAPQSQPSSTVKNLKRSAPWKSPSSSSPPQSAVDVGGSAKHASIPTPLQTPSKFSTPKATSSSRRSVCTSTQKTPMSSYRKALLESSLQETYQFLDADHAVTAAKFSARRLPEIKSLWRSYLRSKASDNLECDNVKDPSTIQAESCINRKEIDTITCFYESNSKQISSRHLRRRTTSHSSRKRHRYPDERRQVEFREKHPKEDVDNDDITGKSRRFRRKKKYLRKRNSSWHLNSQSFELIGEHRIVSTSSLWLETHLWHAKRFHMSHPLSIYGNWCIPLMHSNRGSLAALRLAQMKCTLQDATWEMNGRMITIEHVTTETISTAPGDTQMSDNPLVNLIQKLCPNSITSKSSLDDPAVRSGYQIVEGIVFDVQSRFPYGAIGPARFIFGRRRETGILKSVHYVHVLTHPSIMSEIHRQIEISVDGISSNIQTSIVGGVSLLRVRGANATASITNFLSLNATTKDVDGLSVDSDTMLCHGSVVPISLHTKSSMENRFLQEKDCVLLISHCPNDISNEKSRVLNTAVSGWDILCPASMAREIFLGLDHDSGACPIGYIEDCYLKLEADPPIPLWPRDYPDTPIGERYWMKEESSSSSPSIETEEWKLIKYCMEDCLDNSGRINTELYQHLKRCRSHDKNVHEMKRGASIWSELVDESISSDASGDIGQEQDSVIVVRGSFIMPFEQAIRGWCPQSVLCNSQSDKLQKHRRPRRKQLSPFTSRNVPPLSRIEADSHQEVCKTLLKSLTMPALLRCHLAVEGKGSLRRGMFIKQMMYDDQSCVISSTKEDDTASLNRAEPTVLGFCTAASFSKARGKYHGIGIIASRQLLSIVTEHRRRLMHDEFTMSKGSSGGIVVCLKVSCGFPSGGLESASLSILR